MIIAQNGPLSVSSMGSNNDKVKSLKVKAKNAQCFQNVSFENNTEQFQTQTPNNTHFYLLILILLLIIAYLFFLKK